MTQPVKVISVGRYTARVFAAAFALTFQVVCLAQQVKDVDGNIFFEPSCGSRIRLTSGGAFTQPVLSPDGLFAAFLRNVGIIDDENAPWKGTKAQRTEIWIAETAVADSGHPVFTGAVRSGGRDFYTFGSPRFSPDNQYLYFLIPSAVVTSGLVRLEIASRNVVYIAPALEFLVVPAGKFKSDLVVKQRKRKLSPGTFEWYWLLTPDGKEVGVVGQDEGDVALFLEQQQ